MAKKKVLLVTSRLGRRSGIGRVGMGILDNLDPNRYETICIAESPEDDLPYQSYRLDPGRGIMPMIKNILAIRRLARDCDLIQSLEVWPYATYAHLATIGLGKPHFISGIGTYSIAPQKPGLKKWLIDSTLRAAKKIMCISRYTQQRINERTPGLTNTNVVYLGLNALPHVSAEIVDQYRQQYEIADTARPIMVTVGAIKERKGHLDTLQAVKILKEDYPDVLYCMIGSWPESDMAQKIEEYIAEHGLQDNVKILTDLRSDESLAAFYQMCDLLILASNSTPDFFEGFGLVFLEANDFAKPVIGSLDNGTADAVSEGVSGYLVPQKDPAAIAARVKQLLDQPLDQQGIKDWAHSFTWQKTADAYAAEYEKVLNTD